MRDKGISVPQMVNSLLSECTWGFIKGEKMALEDWVMINGEPSASPPPLPESISPFLEVVAPTSPKRASKSNHKDDKSAANHGESHDQDKNKFAIQVVTYADYVENYTTVSKSDRKLLKQNFTTENEHGNPYALKSDACRSAYNRLLHSLIVSSYDTTEQDELPQYFTSDLEGKRRYIGILPSFFNFVEYMARRAHHDPKRFDFRLLFRTFGDDIADVAEEFNTWCSNEHPLFKLSPDVGPLDGSASEEGWRDYRLQLPMFSGAISRIADNNDGFLFSHLNKTEGMQRGVNVVVTKGAQKCYNIILNDWFSSHLTSLNSKASTDVISFRGTGSAALQDDYSWWNSNGESDSSGKVLLLSKYQIDLHNDHVADLVSSKEVWEVNSDKEIEDGPTNSQHSDENFNVLQVFFDDNIERERAHIVDVRRMGGVHGETDGNESSTFTSISEDGRESFFPLEGEKATGCYLRKVHPFLAISDPLYYIKEIDQYIQSILD